MDIVPKQQHVSYTRLFWKLLDHVGESPSGSRHNTTWFRWSVQDLICKSVNTQSNNHSKN